MIKIIHTPDNINNFIPSAIWIEFEYILYGKSLINLNGKKFAIFANQFGKNGSGIIAPINTSAIVLYVVIIPLDSSVNIVIIWIINDIDVINKHANINEIINNIKLPNE